MREINQSRDDAAASNDCAYTASERFSRCIVRSAIDRCDGASVGSKFKEAGVFDSDISDEDADPAADCVLQAFRDRFDDHFSDFGYSDQNVDHPTDEYHGQSLLPSETK